MSGQAAAEQAVIQSHGLRSGGIGTGYEGAFTLPFLRHLQNAQLQKAQLENERLGLETQYYPQLMMLGAQKTGSEINKNIAEAGKAGAEAQAVPIKAALERAQTEAAYYKDDPNLGLVDIRTGQPVSDAASVPLSAQEAGILGKQPGERVPLKFKNTANEMMNRGIRTVQANGRSLLVDNQGNTIKDMGVATPMAVVNAQLTPPRQLPPEMERMAQGVAAGKIDLATAMRTSYRFPGMTESLVNRVFEINPSFNQANYGISKDTLHYFTVGKGAEELNAFRTSMLHADLLDQYALALKNGDTRTLNSLKNRLKSEFGDPNLTTFNAVASAYTRETQKALSSGHITEGDIHEVGATMPSNANYETIHAVSQAYKNLMASKAQMRMQQYEQGRQGQPAFPNFGNTNSQQQGEHPLDKFWH